MSSDELAQLRAELRYLTDRADILDCVVTHARGCDRHDSEMLHSTYHPDGCDVHGNTVNPGPEYARWANAVHAATAESHTHNITTHACEIDGDTAHAESYVLVGLLAPDRRTTTLVGGRYLDRLERRDGGWRILVRRSTVEWTHTGDAGMLAAPGFLKQGYVRGTRDGDDLSYQRPLRADSPAERW